MKKQNEKTVSTDDVVAQVFKTTEYNKFKYLDGNRSVKMSRVLRILKSIDKVGYRMSPIIVNSRFEVIDGQGRLAALKERQLPVYYVIDESAGIEECRMLNIGMANWSMMDFIESYASGGNADYLALIPFVKEYTDLGIDITLAVCGGAYAAPDSDKVKDGSFKMKRGKVESADWLERFRTTKCALSSFGGSPRSLFGAMMFAIEKCNADKTRMFDRVNGIPEGSIAGLPSNVLGSCRLLEGVYNHHLGGSNRIYFSSEWDKWNRSKENED